MRSGARVLLVHGEERPVLELKALLESQGFRALLARSRAEAEAILARAEPVLIFTDADLDDGTWADVEALAERQRPAIPVIVVSRFVDLPRYVEVLESGAADFIVPPFREADLAWVVRSALTDRPQVISGLPRRAAGRTLEAIQNAQNHAASGSGASHAQAGR